MVHSASFSASRWKKAPEKFEAGTPPIAQAIALGAAIDYLTLQIDFNGLSAYETSLTKALVEGLEQMKGIEIIGNTTRLKQKGHLVSFLMDGLHPHDVASYLDMRGVAVRAGHHCAQPLASLLGYETTLRASLYLYNTLEDIEIFLRELAEVQTLLTEKMNNESELSRGTPGSLSAPS